MSFDKITVVIPAFEPDKALIHVVEGLSQEGASILVVNDGSGPTFDATFNALRSFKNVNILIHDHNQGKGEALKTAFRYLLKEQPELLGVVTADADGQHLVKDIIKVKEALEVYPTHLVLGMRSFQADVPLRSRVGNIMTRYIFACLVGKLIPDTQTGLRGIPRELMQGCLAIQSHGYEFELEMLIKAVNQHLIIDECPITTVYENNNACSHFNPLLDSIKIYMVFLRFAAFGAISAVIDFLVFVLIYALTQHLFISECLARGSGGLFGFFAAKRWVFNSKSQHLPELLKFIALWTGTLLTSYACLYMMINILHANPYISKLLIQGLLFIVSFSVQRLYVFAHKH